MWRAHCCGLPRLERLETIAARQVAAYGLLCALGGVALQLAFLSFYDPNPIRRLFMRTVSELSGTFFGASAAIDSPVTFLRNYPALMPTLGTHAQTHPPAIPLLFWSTGRSIEVFPAVAGALSGGLRQYQCQQPSIYALPDATIASALLGMILPLLSMATLWPLYKISELLYDQHTALRAMTWWPMVPALVMFVPQWNQLYPFFTVLALWLVAIGLRNLRWWPFATAGGVMSVATFFSLTNVSIVGLLGVFMAVWVFVEIRRGEQSSGKWRHLATGLLAFALALASLWVVYFAIFSVSFFEIVRMGLGAHFDLGRPYLPWLFFLLLDVWLFSGIVFGVLAVTQVASGWRSRNVLALTLGLGLLAFDLTGLVRGEVGRLLTWLMPLVVVVAARAVSRTPDVRRSTMLVSLALAAQLAVMVAYLPVIGIELTLAGQHIPSDRLLFASQDVEANFAQQANLVSFGGVAVPDESALDLALEWQAQAKFEMRNFAGVVVLGPDGEILGIHDWVAGGDEYPTTCWRAGETVTDFTHIPLDAMPAGDYWLSLRMFDAESGEPLLVTAPGLPDDTQIGLGPISIP